MRIGMRNGRVDMRRWVGSWVVVKEDTVQGLTKNNIKALFRHMINISTTF